MDTLTQDIAGVRIDRLKKLAEAVELAPEERFDMTWWGMRNRCGTSHCAAGWYVEFNPQEGLKFAGNGREIDIVDVTGNYCGMGGLAVHFGITYVESRDLFTAERDDETREEVLARIRAFIAEKERAAK